ncbi:Isochorismatase (EC [Olavius algarvensis Delta 1 endosymbiont]|nr:Isochorismatase (EC [Olavius algarvensis Delta 1 endosymbiont]
MNTGLILVDIQNDYFPGGRMELTGMERAGLKAGELLSSFRWSQWPTFHIQHIAAQKGATFFLPETEGAEIHQSVAPRDGEIVIQKHYPNSFRETSLLQEIERHDVKKLVICGAMSHMCIDATTRAAFDHCFDCTVVQDACATRDLAFAGQKIAAADVHGSFMAALGSAYAQVISSDELDLG